MAVATAKGCHKLELRVNNDSKIVRTPNCNASPKNAFVRLTLTNICIHQQVFYHKMSGKNLKKKSFNGFKSNIQAMIS